MSFIQKRNIATCVVLSLVTCGFYMIYWVVKVAQEAVKVKDENDNGLVEILLMLFLPFLGTYLAEKKLYEGATEKGLQIADNSVLYLVISLFGFSIVAVALMQNDLNKLADCIPVNGPAANGYYDATNQFNDSQYQDGGFGFAPGAGNAQQHQYNGYGPGEGAQQNYQTNGFDPNNNNSQQF